MGCKKDDPAPVKEIPTPPTAPPITVTCGQKVTFSELPTEAQNHINEFYPSKDNQDKKEDAQRKMAWVALIGMISYPFVGIIAVALGLDASILASIPFPERRVKL